MTSFCLGMTSICAPVPLRLTVLIAAVVCFGTLSPAVSPARAKPEAGSAWMVICTLQGSFLQNLITGERKPLPGRQSEGTGCHALCRRGQATAPVASG